MMSVRTSVAMVVTAAGLSACDLPYPAGAYTPEPVDIESVAAEAGTASPDGSGVFGGMGGTTGAMGGTAGGTAGGTTSGTTGGIGGGVDAGTNPDDPRTKLVGDYYVKVDQYNKASSGLTMVETDAVTYLVAKLAMVGGELKMGDRQCFVNLIQSGASTTIPVSEQKGYHPAERVLKLNGDKWNTEQAPYAIGWKPSTANVITEAPPAAMDDSDPRLEDNDGKGNGVNVKVTSTGFSCDLRVVQKIDLLFSGTLASGQLGSGVTENNGSVQNVIVQSALCPSNPSNSPPTKSDTVRFVRIPNGGSLSGQLECPPNMSVMANAFP